MRIEIEILNSHLSVTVRFISESQNLNTSKNIMGPIKRTGKRVAKVSTISNDKRPDLRSKPAI
jgi:hypothetical protein